MLLEAETCTPRWVFFKLINMFLPLFFDKLLFYLSLIMSFFKKPKIDCKISFILDLCMADVCSSLTAFEPHHKKTCLPSFRTGPTRTSLHYPQKMVRD